MLVPCQDSDDKDLSLSLSLLTGILYIMFGTIEEVHIGLISCKVLATVKSSITMT